MNVKKILTLVVLTAFGLSSHAQIVSSESENVYRIKTKKPNKILFYIKAGVGSNNPNYDINDGSGIEIHDNESKFAPELAVGLRKNFRNSNIFGGAEIGGVTTTSWDEKYGDYGIKYEKESDLIAFANPYIGVDFKIGETTTLSPHIGPSLGLYIHEGEFATGFAIGANIWFNKKFAIGLDYKYYNDLDTHSRVNEKLYSHSILLTGTIKL